MRDVGVERIELTGMDSSWVFLAGLAVVVGGAAVLRTRTRLVQWSFACTITLILASIATWIGSRHPTEPFNAPSALAAVFIIIPMLATFAVERRCWILGGSHPVGTALLSVPIGIIVYILSVLVAVTIAVNLDVIWP